MSDAKANSTDFFVAAHARAAEKQANLIVAAGGVLDPSEAAARLDVSPRTVARWAKDGRLLVLSYQSKRVVPACQIAGRKVIPGLDLVLRAFGTMGPWMKLAFLVSPADRLGNRKPVDLMAGGNAVVIAQVVAAARGFGEHSG